MEDVLRQILNEIKISYKNKEGGVEECSIKEYIEKVADILDNEIQNALIMLAKDAEGFINSWNENRDDILLLGKDFGIGGKVKKCIFDDMGSTSFNKAIENKDIPLN